MNATLAVGTQEHGSRPLWSISLLLLGGLITPCATWSCSGGPSRTASTPEDPDAVIDFEVDSSAGSAVTLEACRSGTTVEGVLAARACEIIAHEAYDIRRFRTAFYYYRRACRDLQDGTACGQVFSLAEKKPPVGLTRVEIGELR